MLILNRTNELLAIASPNSNTVARVQLFNIYIYGNYCIIKSNSIIQVRGKKRIKITAW